MTVTWAGLAAFCAAFGGYALWENTWALRVARDTIPMPGYQGEPLRLLLLSDLHDRLFGENYERLVETVQAAQPDLILIPGDLISRDRVDFAPTCALMHALTAVCPVYYAFGNHEIDLPAHARTKLLLAAHDSGVTVLDDRVVRLQEGLYLAGATLRRSVYRNEKNGFSHLIPYRQEELEAALGKKPGTTILLGHNPLCLEAYAGWGAELVLSGHVHGGAVRLPGVGLLSPERRFFPKYSRGVYHKEGTTMVVSGGLGKLRLWNPPELRLITLTGA